MKIIQRKDGRYQAELYLGKDPRTGKRLRKSVSAKTREECREKARALMMDADTYRAPASDMPFDAYARAWLRDCTAQQRDKTRENTLGRANRHIIPYFQKMPLNAVSPLDCQRFVNQLTTIKPSTVRGVVAQLSQMFKDAIKAGLIYENPCTGLKLPKRGAPDIRPLDRDQLGEFLGQCPPDVYGDLFRFLAFTGLRVGEALGLTWDRVKDESLIIDRQTDGAGGFAPTKSGRARVVPLPAPALVILERLKDADASGHVFKDDKGRPLKYLNTKRRFDKLRESAGFPRLRIHDLRHTYAVLSLLAGVDIKALSGALGHTSCAFTLDIYAFYSDTLRDAQREKLNAYLSAFCA